MKFEVYLGRFFMVLVAVFATFLVLDRVSPYFLPDRSEMERKFPVDITRYPKPYVMFGGKPNENVLNPMGYKGNVPDPQKKDDAYRIFVLGGSTVFNGNPPIPALLEAEFRAHGFETVNVYNFGVVASMSGMEIARIVFEVSDLQPDLIVLYNGGNDIFSPWCCDPRPGYPYNFLAYEANPILQKDMDAYPAAALILYGSNIFRYLFPDFFLERFTALDRKRKDAEWLSEAWGIRIADTYINNMIKADKLARAFDSDLIVFFQPLLYYKKSLTPEERKHYPKQTNYPNYVKKTILQKAIAAQKQTPLRFVNLSDMFTSASEQIFTDHIHITQAAKTVIAKSLYQHIRSVFNDRITAAARDQDVKFQ